MLFAGRIETSNDKRKSNNMVWSRYGLGYHLDLLDHQMKFQGVNQMAKNKRPIVNMASSQSRAEFNPDYTHVKKDLARIGTLAGFFIVLLIVLSFFLK